MLDRASRIAEVVKSAGDVDAGVVTVGYVPSARSTVLPAMVRALRRKRPRLSLQLQEMISSDQADALVAPGQLETGVVLNLIYRMER